MNTEENVALIPPIQFFSLMDEVEALPMRKRSKWHGFVKDMSGVKRKVYYRAPGQLVLKDHSELIQLKPTDEALDHYLVFDNQESEDMHRRWMGAYERGGWAEVSREHDRMVAENATGNHRSKSHKIRVPTKAGEPVRA